MTVEYVLPVGLHLDPGAAVGLREGYEVEWRDEGSPPHYAFHAQLSALRLERFFREALLTLPPFCRAVIEVRRSDAELDADPDGPQQDRWTSGVVPRGEILTILERYSFQLMHDGMVGFGAYDPDSPLEVFLDDHKLFSLLSPALEPFEGLLAAHGVPHARAVHTLLDLEHEHCTLPAVPERSAVPRARELRRRRLDVAWFAQAIQRRLGMQRSR